LPAASSRIRDTGKKAFVGKNAARILVARGGRCSVVYGSTLPRAALPAASSRIRDTGKKAFVGKNAARILVARGGRARQRFAICCLACYLIRGVNHKRKTTKAQNDFPDRHGFATAVDAGVLGPFFRDPLEAEGVFLAHHAR
jgi:hypothetical protein